MLRLVSTINIEGLDLIKDVYGKAEMMYILVFKNGGVWMITDFTPYLIFDGDAIEAIRLYEKAFGVEAKVMRFKDAPPDPNHPVPEEAKERVMHALIKLGEVELRVLDTFP